MIELLIAAALAQGVPQDIFVAMCSVESNLNPKAVNRGDGGADSIGICQVQMPAARHVGFTGTRAELFKPSVNANVAAKYFRMQLDRYNGNVVDAVVAYNAGRSIKYRKYVDKVFKRAVDLHVGIK